MGNANGDGVMEKKCTNLLKFLHVVSF